MIQLVKIYAIAIVCFFNLKFIDKQINPQLRLNLLLRCVLTLTACYLYTQTMPRNIAYDQPPMMFKTPLVIIPALKLLQIFLFADSKSRLKMTFIQFLLEMLWPLIPINRVPSHKHVPVAVASITKLLFTNTAPLFLWSYLSLVASQYLQSYLNECLHDKETVVVISSHYVYFMFYTFIQTLAILSSISLQNALCAVVTLLTLNRYQFLAINHYPLFAVSITEVWSRRYSRLMRTVLHQAIFTPARKHGFSKATAAMFAFVASGLAHIYMAYKLFGRGLLSNFAFFVLHGMATVIESYVYGKEKTTSAHVMMIRAMITLTFFLLTLPLIMGLFVQAYPGWGLAWNEFTIRGVYIWRRYNGLFSAKNAVLVSYRVTS